MVNADLVPKIKLNKNNNLNKFIGFSFVNKEKMTGQNLPNFCF